MDIYTTSFCLPHRLSSSSSRSPLNHHHQHHHHYQHQQQQQEPVPSTAVFDYLPTTREQASGGSSSPYHQSRQQQQNQQVVVPPPPTYSRHQSTRSVSFSSRPASIPEDTRGEDSQLQSSTSNSSNGHHHQHQLGESTSSSSSAGMSSNRAGGGNNTYYAQGGGGGGAYGDSGNINAPNTAIGSGSGPTSAATSAGLAPRRSTSSLASLGQQTSATTGTTISISSSNTSLVGASSGSAAAAGGGGGNDGASTAPSSQAGHGHKHGGHTHAGTTGIHPNYSSKMTMTQAGGGDMNGSSSSQATTTPNNGNATTLEGSHTSAAAAAAAAANNTSAASIAAAQRANAELAEQMQKLCMDAMSNYQCMVTCSPFFENTTTSSSSPSPSAKVMMMMSLPSYNFILSGGYQQVMAARGFILRTSPFYKKSIVKVPRSEVLSSSSSSSYSSSSMTNNGTNGNGGASSTTTTTAEERVKPEMKNKLDEIAALTRAHLAIVGQQQQQQRQESSSSRVPTSASSAGAGTHDAGNGVYNGGNGSGSGSTMGFGLETERFVEIVITGSYESVEQARVRLLVLLDELSGLHSDVCEIDYKLHNIVSGRKRSVIQTIQEETATNIYFPTPLTGILGSGPSISPRDNLLLSKQNLIFITGEFFGVQRARDMLFQVSLHKSKMIISRDTAILPRKLDWLLLLSSESSSTASSLDDDHHDKVHDLRDRLEDQVKNIMFDNGTFINFPMLGSQASLISVYGDHRVNIERTLRALMNLATQFYVSQFWLLPMQFDVFNAPPMISPSEVPAILKLISATTGAEAVFKSNCFEFHGLESEVRTAVQLLLELDIVKSFHHEIRFQIELGNEHRDFISGKKNGKLNKIMKTAGVKIKFETFNDYNFLIDIAGNASGALHGLSLLQEELPAEVSFHVPEIYHKRIIGVGGKNIQRIMKKYGVYVKFSNAEEFAALGGYHQNEDNVIARTPAKNSPSLDQLKAAVMEMVIPKDKDYVVETVSIPRRYHRTLLGEKSIFIHDIEAKTNSVVRFPNKETASDVVSIFGPESQVHIAAQMLLDHVPFEAEYRLPHSETMAQLTLAPDFIALQDQIKRDLNIMILPWVDRSGAGEETVIKFLLNRSNQHFLASARDTVEEFLQTQNVSLYSSSHRPRSDSFATSFPFFNSKLLSTLGESESSSAQSPGVTNGAAYTAEAERPVLRPAASSPDIKALFEAPSASQAYNYLPPDTTPLNTNVNIAGQSPSYHYQPLYQQQTQQDRPQQQSQKIVAAALPELRTPRFYAPQASHKGGHHHTNYSISANFVPSHSTRLSDELINLASNPATTNNTANTDTTSSASKRESDPIMMDDKLKDMIRRGALGHHHLNARAQSLDISQQTKTFGRHAAPSTADSEAVSAALSQLRL